MLKFGNISEAKPGFGRVQFQEDDVVSDWLPIAVTFGFGNKAVWTLLIQQQVACLMDENCETGVIIGATYNDVDTPPTTNANLFDIEFSDGTKIQYNKSSHELKADVKGKVTVLATSTIEANTSGDIKATGANINATASAKITAVAPEFDVTSTVIKLTGAVTVIGMITAGGITVSSASGGTGKMTGDGDIETTGIIKAAQVYEGPIQLGTHKHTGVTTGAGISGTPTP